MDVQLTVLLGGEFGWWGDGNVVVFVGCWWIRAIMLNGRYIVNLEAICRSFCGPSIESVR